MSAPIAGAADLGLDSGAADLGLDSRAADLGAAEGACGVESGVAEKVGGLR